MTDDIHDVCPLVRTHAKDNAGQPGTLRAHAQNVFNPLSLHNNNAIAIFDSLHNIMRVLYFNTYKIKYLIWKNTPIITFYNKHLKFYCIQKLWKTSSSNSVLKYVWRERSRSRLDVASVTTLRIAALCQ